MKGQDNCGTDNDSVGESRIEDLSAQNSEEIKGGPQRGGGDIVVFDIVDN
jgi:hypothetical protein